ncbi:MAG: DNA repair protein RadC [Leptolinea sp.]|nr:DNA repair protein RadC [Leptolinea sp.]
MINKNLTVYRIQDYEANDRPRERLAESGAGALSNAELLAILLRTGLPGENAVQIGHRLLKFFGGLTGLHRVSFDELCNQRGVGLAKASQIKAAIELGRRLPREEADEKPVIKSPADAANLVQYDMLGLPQENLWVLLLDTRNRVLKIEKLYQGSLNSSTVRIGELFKAALTNNAASIILAHNHPSGDPTPSPEDVALTRAAREAGRLLDVEVLDHIVIGQNKFVSLKDRGLGFG